MRLPSPGQLQTQATAQAHQHNAANAVVAVACCKNVPAKQLPSPKAQQRPTDKADSV